MFSVFVARHRPPTDFLEWNGRTFRKSMETDDEYIQVSYVCTSSPVTERRIGPKRAHTRNGGRVDLRWALFACTDRPSDSFAKLLQAATSSCCTNIRARLPRAPLVNVDRSVYIFRSVASELRLVVSYLALWNFETIKN